MRSVLALEPTINFSLASERERGDLMVQLARVLMAQSQPCQLVSQARPVDPVDNSWRDWPEPPRIERRWYAATESPDGWGGVALKRSLGSIGMRCKEIEPSEPDTGERHHRNHCLDRQGYFCSTLVLRRWPREVYPGWLGHALSKSLADVAIHVLPMDQQPVARHLRKQADWQSEANAAKHDAANALGQEDADRVRRALVAGTDRAVRVAVAITVRGRTPDELREQVKLAGHELELTLADARVADGEPDRGLEATSLGGRLRIEGAWRTLDCTSVASTWLLQPGIVNHANGAELGVSNGMLVKLDPFDPTLESFGALVVAKVGAGKSFLLKLIARRLPGVEVLIVEQREPPEYTGVPNATTLSLGDIDDDDERAAKLAEFVSNLWERAKVDPRPRLLILDELWSLIREPKLRKLVGEIARIGRHHYLSLWIATQQTRDLLEHAPSVLDNAMVRIYLKQHDHDLDQLADAVGLSVPARRYLRTAARGQALLDVNGMMIPLDVQASPEEHRLITTDPRERVAA